MTAKKNDPAANLKKLTYNRKNVWDVLKPAETKKMESYSQTYMKFLDASKTEREAVDNVLKEIKSAGYVDIHEAKNTDKVFYNQHGKSLAIFRKGKKGLTAGLNIIVAHLDSPRLDLKQNPVTVERPAAIAGRHSSPGPPRRYHVLSIYRLPGCPVP